MGSEAHLRIDEGIARGPRKKINRQPKAATTGQFLPKFTPEQKSQILEESYQALSTTGSVDPVAAKHGITGRAIRHWLLDDPKADEARRMLINGELARTLDEMKEAKNADSPLPLACAREEFRAWSWVAERRESRLYGQKQELTVTHTIPSDVLKEIRELGQELGVVADIPQIAPQQSPIIDVVPEPLDITKQE